MHMASQTFTSRDFILAVHWPKQSLVQVICMICSFVCFVGACSDISNRDHVLYTRPMHACTFSLALLSRVYVLGNCSAWQGRAPIWRLYVFFVERMQADTMPRWQTCNVSVGCTQCQWVGGRTGSRQPQSVTTAKLNCAFC